MRKLLILLAFVFSFSSYAIRISQPPGGGAALPPGIATAPVWQTFNINFSDYTAVANQEDISLFTVPTDGVIHAIQIKHITPFSGGTITGYTLSVGPVGDLDQNASDFDVFQATGPAVLQNSTNLVTFNSGATTDLRIRATSVGDTLNNAVAGVAQVRVLVSAP